MSSEDRRRGSGRPQPVLSDAETRRRTFLSKVMRTAWQTFGIRHLPGSTVRTFADALRNSWAFHKAHRQPGPDYVSHVRLRSMLKSPIRNSLSGPYAETHARAAGYLTSTLGR